MDCSKMYQTLMYIYFRALLKPDVMQTAYIAIPRLHTDIIFVACTGCCESGALEFPAR